MVNFTITFAYKIILMYLANISAFLMQLSVFWKCLQFYNIYFARFSWQNFNVFREKQKVAFEEFGIQYQLIYRVFIKYCFQILFFFLQDFKIYSRVAMTGHTRHLPRCRGVCTPSFTLGPPGCRSDIGVSI